MRLQLVMLAASLVVCELILQILSGPIDRWLEPIQPMVADAALGLRGNPGYPGHDARGYRNAMAVQRAEVVALGDSHTYGVGVTPGQAWPALLAARLKRTVYSMAHGSYGPGHYVRMLDTALALHPRIVVVGLYFGNDLYDTYVFDRGGPLPAGLSDLATRAAAADAISPIQEQASTFWKAGGPKPVREWLGSHIQLYRLAHRVRKWVAPSKPVTTPQQDVLVVDGDGWHGALRITYRRLALDQRDPRILLGFERSLAALTLMATRCRSEGVTMLVLVLPTKESVFWTHVPSAKRPAPLVDLVSDEAWFRDQLFRRLRELGVPILDPLPALRASATQTYPETLDGHPNPLGHRIIAEFVARWISDHL